MHYCPRAGSFSTVQEDSICQKDGIMWSNSRWRPPELSRLGPAGDTEASSYKQTNKQTKKYILMYVMNSWHSLEQMTGFSPWHSNRLSRIVPPSLVCDTCFSKESVGRIKNGSAFVSELSLFNPFYHWSCRAHHKEETTIFKELCRW